MALLKIARMGNPLLRKKARKLNLKEIQSLEIRRLIDDMIETMRDADGVGLAAPQVYQSIQLAVLEIDASNPRYKNSGISAAQPLMIIINPEIKVLEKKRQGYWEGCLSIPGLRGFVERPRKIQVRYLDRNGKECKLVASNFLATVIQHELDHLNGTLYIDHISPKNKDKLAFIEEFQKYELSRT